MLAPPTGCDGMVNMGGFSQLGNIGSLNSIIQQLSSPTNNSPGISIKSASTANTVNNGITPSASKINNFPTYDNITYGISSIQYPADWTIGKMKAPAKDTSLIGGSCKLSKISVPALIITGTEDIAVPAANFLIFAQKIPGSWLVQIQGAGHGLMYQYPDKLSKVLQTFLSLTNTMPAS
jgi:TAP-like protein